MLSVLMLADIRAAAQCRVAILDHLHFLDHAAPDRVRVTYVNMAETPTFDPTWLEHDVIILHTTLLCWRWQTWYAQAASWLSWMEQYRGLVVAMPQDEYNHAHLLDDWLATLNAAVIVTCFDETHRALLYPRMHQRAYFLQALTGFLNPKRLPIVRSQLRPIATRTTDIVYRANNTPWSLGWLGYTKSRLGSEARDRLARTSLRCDISVNPADTVLGDAWLPFIAGSRAILGSESGSSVLDRRGEMRLHVQALLADQPTLSFDALNALTGGELTRYHFGALGPRHLEAMLTGTVQVLVEGAYQGLLRPWEHYIPLARDLSDLEALPERLADPALLQQIADRTYEEFVASGAYTYDRFANHVLDVLGLFLQVKQTSTSQAA